MIHLFWAEGLEQLVCSSHHLDTLELQAGARYDDEYTADSQVGPGTDARDWQSEGAVKVDASRVPVCQLKAEGLSSDGQTSGSVGGLLASSRDWRLGDAVKAWPAWTRSSCRQTPALRVVAQQTVRQG